jgi:hypothetical protein
MSNYTPITLVGEIVSFTPYEYYAEVDGSGLENEPKSYILEMNSIQDQLTFDSSSREAGKFNGIDIVAGYWISDTDGSTILKIMSIEEKTETTIKCLVEDVDMQSYRLYGSNTIGNTQKAVIFGTNHEGSAILIDTSEFTPGSVDRLQARFFSKDIDDRFLFRHDTAPNVTNGNVVTIDSNGNLVKLGSNTAASQIPIGIVVSLIRGGKDVYVKPFNSILTATDDPEGINNAIGTVYYSDNTNNGEITTTQTVGSRPIFLQVTSPTETEVVATDSNLPGAVDVVTINDIEVFDGANDTVSSVSDLVTLINTFTNQTKVSAEEQVRYVSTSSNDNSLVYNGIDPSSDVLILIAPTGTTPASYPQLTISDGTNSVTVTFNTADLINVAGSGFDAASISEIYDTISAALTGSSVDIAVTLTDLTGSGIGDGIKLTTTNASASISLSATNDANGTPGSPLIGVGSCLGLDASVAALDNVLRLYRPAGGMIKITGSPVSGSYINTNGITSSSNGRTPYVLFLEGVAEEPSTTEVGVSFSGDKNQTSILTTGNDSATGITITYTPFADSDVSVRVNGIEVNVGDGTKTEDCYFSGDGGTTARLMVNIEAGDELYWNGDNAEFELDGADDVDISYQANRIDL